jgi:hypothetical protein
VKRNQINRLKLPSQSRPRKKEIQNE